MPYVMNGCGTWYYGKKNLETYEGRCRACGKDGNLRSYDTTLYFVLLFIPVFPLKKRHIIDECPQCKRHFALAPTEWQRIRDEEISKAFQEFRANPKTEELAKNALTRCVAYRERERFAELVVEVKKIFPRSTDLLISIGQMQIFLGLLDDAEKTFSNILQLDPINEVASEGLAETYIRMLKPEKAEPLLSHIIDIGIPDKAFYFNWLAGSYQAVGKHSEALESLKCTSELVPQIEGDNSYKKMRRISEKHLATGKSIKPDWLRTYGKIISSQSRDVSGRIARTVPYVIFSALLITYLISACWIGQHRQVYLVNGLKKAYSVRVNSKELKLVPLRPMPLQIQEGLLRIEPVKPDDTLSPVSVNVTTNFFTRPFVTRTFVLNPDKTAIIVRQTMHYIPKNEEAASTPENKYECHANKQCHIFGSVNYLFEPYPDTIKMQSSSSVAKTRLYILGQDGDISYEERIAAYVQNVEKEQAIGYLEGLLKYDPQSVMLIYKLAEMAAPETFLTIAKPYLAQRPVCIHWHRAYQDMVEKTDPDENLESKYNSLLRAEPNNKPLQYLAGRVSRDTNESFRLMSSAASLPNPVPQAWGALCYAYMSNGEFKNALEAIRKAHELDPNDESFRNQLLRSLVACKVWNEALKLVKKERPSGSSDVSDILAEATVLSQAGRLDEAQKLISSQFERLYGSADIPALKKHKAAIDNWVLYVSGAYEQAVRSHIQLGEKWWEMVQSIQDGNMPQAERISQEGNFVKLQDHTLLYIGETLAGRKSEASGHLDALVSCLEKDSWEHRRFAKALKTGVETDPKTVLSLPMQVEEKRVILLAMAFRYPNYRKQYLDMALRLWYDGTPPIHFVKKLSELQ
jgi:tetratricopeptide (TPR) repeat protein